MDNYTNLPSDYPTPPMNYPRVEEKNISIIRELSPQETLQEMMYQLQGKIWDKKTQNWIKMEGAKPLLNQDGQDSFFQYANAVISMIVTMSNFTNNYKLIHDLVRYQAKRVTQHFYINHKKYDLEVTKVNMLTSKIVILGLSAFYKAIGAGDRKAGTSHITESISRILRPTVEGEFPESSKKSIFSRLLGR